MIFTDKTEIAHRNAATCHVCNDPFDGDSIKDHCHITGKYHGLAHKACNLKLRINSKTIIS